MSLAAWLQAHWFSRRRPVPALWLLAPLHWLFVVLSTLRRRLYVWGWLHVRRLPVPVVVVGNLSLGGAGKTPLTLWLAAALAARGWRPAIISRGYGAAGATPRPVLPTSTAAEVGDEPLLLARRGGVPVWVGRDRAAVGAALLAAHPEVDLLIADDGLQHYRLARDVEIVVVDGRGFGNGWRLPLGPLREPPARLDGVDALVVNGEPPAETLLGVPAALPAFRMRLQPGVAWRLADAATLAPERLGEALRGRNVHALAGIGHPQRFFATLQALGVEFTPHAFPDHHAYVAANLDFGPEAVLLMTEKDAVKCAGLTPAPIWVLPVAAELPPALAELLVEKINGRQAS